MCEVSVPLIITFFNFLGADDDEASTDTEKAHKHINARADKCLVSLFKIILTPVVWLVDFKLQFCFL